jgi:hypothetical protein
MEYQSTWYHNRDEQNLHFTAVKALNLKFILAAKRDFVSIHWAIGKFNNAVARTDM